MDKPTYTVVIPAYNEGERIAGTLQRLLEFACQQNWNAEIVVVDDGSRDDTATLVERFREEHSLVRLLQNPGNRGKGFAVRNGMMHAQGEVLLFTDADLSAPISESIKLFDAIGHGAQVAIGSRWLRSELQTERQPLYRQLFGRLFNLLLWLILGLRFRDTQCGFKAFTRQAAQEIFSVQKIDRWGFDPELLFLAKKYHLPVMEVPVSWAHDTRSKIRPLRDGTRMFLEMLTIRWNDLTGKYPSA